MGIRYAQALFFVVLALVFGCSRSTRHEIVTTLFDGVPSLPPQEEICEDYAAKAVAKMRADMAGRATDALKTEEKASTHPPYAEKKCDGCHDKTTNSGFVSKTKEELCFVCHKGFIKGSFVHGPVSVGDCLACHEPHNSNFPSLLKVSRDVVCATCHREERLAGSLHKMAGSHDIICVNCHDPHFGNIRYFIK